MKTGKRVRERVSGQRRPMFRLCRPRMLSNCFANQEGYRKRKATASIGLTLLGQLLDDSSGVSKYWFPTRGCLQIVVRGWNLAESVSDAIQEVKKLMVVGRCGGEVGYEWMEK